MEARREIHQRFVDHFHSGELLRSITDAELDGVERALNTMLPRSFREFMTSFGAVYTPRILDLINNQRLNHPDIQEFLSPEDSIENSKGYWSAGMPSDIIGFASDCMANMFGFKRCNERKDDLPVVFFDHDYVTTTVIAPSFDAFLQWYLSNASGT